MHVQGTTVTVTLNSDLSVGQLSWGGRERGGGGGRVVVYRSCVKKASA